VAEAEEGSDRSVGPTAMTARAPQRSENFFEPHGSLDRRADRYKREDTMICVAVTYVIQPGHEEEAIELFATLTQQTHAEPLNLYYLVHRSLTEPCRFFLYEQYIDQSALDTHRASPYFAQYVTNGLFNILEKREGEIYVPLP
jgi:(4S)-4-hydroxy-5-phosphonooxypentane-2,3-dione isomerase